MQTYHIHISGRVQGVGFRPFVCNLAAAYKLNGTVSNNTDGVHININAEKKEADLFHKELLLHPPANSIITNCRTAIKTFTAYSGFSITESKTDSIPDLLITPDIALCADCKKEISDPKNRRNGYAFTTCLNCGPRYSIINALPYDRKNTTMAELQMCEHCNTEYTNFHDNRQYSQTNSCSACAITMQLYESGNNKPYEDQSDIISKLTTALASGKIAGVKVIGGYLLLCDATNEEALQTLRSRKHRPFKPFAILYPDIPAALDDLDLNDFEIEALTSKVAPIVLCSVKENIQSGICVNLVAPHLDKIGIMLPYTPLLQLISNQFTKPLIATSANLSGSPIIYSDKEALDTLWDFADLIVTYNREIVTPQDDSVWQFTQGGQRIVLRRSRGMAPDFYPQQIGHTSAKVMAMGADMKSAFAMHHQDKIYISQYLGDQGDYLSQESYHKTSEHLQLLFDFNPSSILIDKHPGYFTSLKGKEISIESAIPLESFQHHKAHFGAVLAENDLLTTGAPVLGFVWDGTGYGDDHQIWGGEVFIYDKGEMDRTLYLDYFPQILGDKMSREPRLSALSLLKGHSKSSKLLSAYFSTNEWDYYQKLLSKEDNLLTSSMGRLIDGLAALIGICIFNTYEGQAAMELEVLARSYRGEMNEYYPLPIRHNRIDWRSMIEEIITDLDTDKDKAFIAKKFYVSLVKLIEQTSDIYDINELAFSGGVFQNALLTGMITESLSGIKKVYFHKQISPNDESIALGQLALYHLQNKEQDIVLDKAMHLSQ